MPATQTQIDKVNAAVTPLYSDPDFATVTDISVSLTQTPPVPAPEVAVVEAVLDQAGLSAEGCKQRQGCFLGLSEKRGTRRGLSSTCLRTRWFRCSTIPRQPAPPPL